MEGTGRNLHRHQRTSKFTDTVGFPSRKEPASVVTPKSTTLRSISKANRQWNLLGKNESRVEAKKAYLGWIQNNGAEKPWPPPSWKSRRDLVHTFQISLFYTAYLCLFTLIPNSLPSLIITILAFFFYWFFRYMEIYEKLSNMFHLWSVLFAYYYCCWIAFLRLLSEFSLHLSYTISIICFILLNNHKLYMNTSLTLSDSSFSFDIVYVSV